MKKTTLVIIFIMMLWIIGLSCMADGLQDAYNQALLLLTQGKYTEAAALFDNMFGYEDSNLYATYAKGLNAGENGDYELALQAFEMLGDFRDSNLQYKYYQARQYESWEDFWSWDQAITIYEDMQLFRDCYSRIESLEEKKQDQYDDAMMLGHSGALEEAAIAFSGMNGYARSTDYGNYYWACVAEKENDYSNALFYLGYLRELGDFENSREQYQIYGEHFIDNLVRGEIVEFGYRQWYVLDTDNVGKRILLLMVNTLDHYFDYRNRRWENSEMREWLNRTYDGFLNNDYFNDTDYGLIDTTLVRQNAGMDFSDGTSEILYLGSESDVYDKVFELSVEEAQTFLPYIGNENELPIYWLRDTYIYQNIWMNNYWENYGYYVRDGAINHTSSTYDFRADVRPALWINLN